MQGSEALCFPAYVSGCEILLSVLSRSLLCLSVRRCTLLSLAVLARAAQEEVLLCGLLQDPAGKSLRTGCRTLSFLTNAARSSWGSWQIYMLPQHRA